jgi:hypothetical protein
MIPSIPELLSPSQHGAILTHCAECESLALHLAELERLGLDVTEPRNQLAALEAFFGALRDRITGATP